MSQIKNAKLGYPLVVQRLGLHASDCQGLIQPLVGELRFYKLLVAKREKKAQLLEKICIPFLFLVALFQKNYTARNTSLCMPC